MSVKILDLNDREAPIHSYIHFQGVNRDQEIALVQCGHQQTLPEYGFGPMIRDHHLIHFIMSGKGRLYVHNHIYHLVAGNCFLIYPHQIAYYEADSSEPWEYYWIGLCGYAVENLLEQAGFKYDRFILPLSTDSPVFPTLTSMVEAISQNEIDLYLSGMLRIALYYLIQNRTLISPGYKPIQGEISRHPGTQSGMEEEYVRIITSIIQTSFGENISVEQMSDKLGLNRSYLTALFHKHTGRSIRSYLTDYRIERACILLKDERRTIAAVASEVGFNDPLYFSRAFRQLKGCSPRAYRQNLFEIGV